MKQATCKQLRGVCNEVITGQTAEQMAENGKKHVIKKIMAGDEAHKEAVDDMRTLTKDEQQDWYDQFVKNFESLESA